MPDPRQFDPDRIRVVLDHGGAGGARRRHARPRRARSPRAWCSGLRPGVLGQSPGCCRSGRRCRGSSTTRLDRTWMSWICRGRWSWPLRCSVVGEEPIVRSLRGSRVIPNRQRLAAVAVLGEREAHLSAMQRLALVDAAAWWLS